MRFVSFEGPDGASWGALVGDDVADVGSLGAFATLREAIGVASAGEMAWMVRRAPRLSVAGVRLLPPVPEPGKILCVAPPAVDDDGAPDRPAVVARFADTLVGDGERLVAPCGDGAFDFEGELAVVIGTGGRDIAVAEALEHVFGYSVFNDATVRVDAPSRDALTAGNFPCTGAFGPAVVTPDEVGPLEDLVLRTRLNGAVVQQGRLGDLPFDVATVVSSCSRWTQLRPGDVIATGSPSGAGASARSPVWMLPGDVCQVSIDRIGHLTNPVADATADASDFLVG